MLGLCGASGGVGLRRVGDVWEGSPEGQAQALRPRICAMLHCPVSGCGRETVGGGPIRSSGLRSLDFFPPPQSWHGGPRFSFKREPRAPSFGPTSGWRDFGQNVGDPPCRQARVQAHADLVDGNGVVDLGMLGRPALGKFS